VNTHSARERERERERAAERSKTQKESPKISVQNGWVCGVRKFSRGGELVGQRVERGF
jgi:hypothetical protein